MAKTLFRGGGHDHLVNDIVEGRDMPYFTTTRSESEELRRIRYSQVGPCREKQSRAKNVKKTGWKKRAIKMFPEMSTEKTKGTWSEEEQVEGGKKVIFIGGGKGGPGESTL